MSGASLDLRPDALSIAARPGNAHTIELTWPAGALDGTTWAASLGGNPIDVDVAGDVMSFSFVTPAASVSGHQLVITQTDPTPDFVPIVGEVLSSPYASNPATSTQLTVAGQTGLVTVNVVGTVPAAGGGGASLSDADPAPVGVAGPGVSGEASRGDHVHGDSAAVTAHLVDTANPHEVTKAQVGLDQVDNTADAAKPVSTAQQTALDGKEPTLNAAGVVGKFTGVPDGSLFLRDDGTLAAAGAGAGVSSLNGRTGDLFIGPSATFIPPSGSHITSATQSGNGTSTLLASAAALHEKVLYIPVWLAGQASFDRVGLDVTGAADASSVLRFGLYDADSPGDGHPRVVRQPAFICLPPSRSPSSLNRSTHANPHRPQ